MSFTDPEPEVAQPDPGQGDGGATGGDPPYADYLSRIPEEVRGDVEPVFRDWDANVTKRFQDHAEFRKQWEPFAETGVNQLSQDEVSWLVQFRQALDDPQVMQQWWDGYARESGLTPAHQAKAEPQAEPAQLDDYGFQDPSQQLEKLLEERLGPLSQQLEQFSSRFAAQDEQAEKAQALQFIEGQVAEIEQKHGSLNETTKDLLNTLAGKYIESDPMNAIPRAYDDLQRWRNDVEKSTLQAKVDQPAPAETGGVPDVSPPQHSRIDAAGVKEAAIEFLRNSNRA